MNLPSYAAPSSPQSCKVLGVSHGEVLSYLDSKLDRADFYQAVGDLVLRIRRIRPQVIVTFGPDGGLTGHLDHAMAGVFGTMAFEWAGRKDRYPEQLQDGLTPHQAQKLYYHASDFLLPDRPPISQPTITTRLEIGAGRFEQKDHAFRQHTTQTPLFERVRKNLGDALGTMEMFHLAATKTPQQAKNLRPSCLKVLSTTNAGLKIQSEADLCGFLRRAEKACKSCGTILGDKSGLVAQLRMRLDRFSDVVNRGLNAIQLALQTFVQLPPTFRRLLKSLDDSA